MLYMLSEKSVYTERDLKILFLKVEAIRSNTGGFFDRMKYPELMYAFYVYAPFDYTDDWKVNAGILEKKLCGLIKNEATNVSFLCLKIIGRDVPEISGKISIIGKWKDYLKK